MKLPSPLKRSPSSSPPSSSPPSPASSASFTTSPPSPSKKRIPFFSGRSTKSKKLDSPTPAISQTPTSSSSPTSSPRSPSTVTASDHRAVASPPRPFSDNKAKSIEQPSTAQSAIHSNLLPFPDEKTKSAEQPSTVQSARYSNGEIAAESTMDEIQQVFAQFDTNGDGKISSEELRAVLALLGDETTSEEAEQMVREVDLDGDGYLNLEEFVRLNKRCAHGATEEEEMRAVFEIFDADKNGWITAEELQAVLHRLGGGLAQGSSVEDCKRMIRGVDRKGLGHVDFDDFMRMMTPLIF